MFTPSGSTSLNGGVPYHLKHSIFGLRISKRPFHWISMKSRLVRAARETSKFQNSSLLTNSRHRYMAEILPIRRKTLSNQLINPTRWFTYLHCLVGCLGNSAPYYRVPGLVFLRHDSRRNDFNAKYCLCISTST